MDRLRKGGESQFKQFLDSLLNTHPTWKWRRLALSEQSAAFRADRIHFMLQGSSGYRDGDLTPNAVRERVPGVSTLAERRQYLHESLVQFPRSVPAAIVVSALAVTLSQFLVLKRLGASRSAATDAHDFSRAVLSIPALVGAGACLALLCSQTFLWELSQRSWNFRAWLASDPDRASICAASWFGTVATVITILIDGGR